MPNTNFQTIHQMGQAINEVVRQATGRDAVQNIDMDHVTVAQNQYYEEVSVSGSMVSFTDRVGNTPLEKCIVQIEPVQDLHGYDHPWAGGEGKNLCPPVFTQAQGSTTGYAYTLNDDGSVTITGSYTGSANGIIDLSHANRFVLPAGTYIVSGGTTEIFNRSGIRPQIVNAATNAQIVLSGAPATFTLSEDTEIWYRFHIQYEKASQAPMPLPSEGITFYPMIRLASVSDDRYEPYSNICPITGWDEANIHVSPTTDAQDGQTYSITFPAETGTVYGGTLDVKSGVLTVTHRLWSTNNRPATDPTGIGTEGDITYFWLYTGPGNRTYFNGIKCDKLENYQSAGYISSGFRTVSVYQASLNIFMPSTLVGTTKNSINAYLDANPINFWVKLVTPITYQLTPTEVITLVGQNNIWADTGDIEVKVKLLKELY